MFHGFTEKTREFLFGLMLNNERSWFQAHKEEYTEHLLTPCKELTAATYDLFCAKFPDLPLISHLSRIYRDARRTHGKGPYKDHLWISFKSWPGLLEGPMFWFEIGAFNYSYGMGFYSASPTQMAIYRKLVDENPKPLKNLIKKYESQSRFILTGEEYARPKIAPDPLLAQWYNKKRIGLQAEFPWEGDIFSSDLPSVLVDAFSFLMPYYQFFAEIYVKSKVLT